MMAQLGPSLICTVLRSYNASHMISDRPHWWINRSIVHRRGQQRDAHNRIERLPIALHELVLTRIIKRLDLELIALLDWSGPLALQHVADVLHAFVLLDERII